MDFDSIISIIILMLFFALPLIKRQIKAKKQKIKEELRTLKAKQKSFKPQKFTEQIQNFFKIPETSKSEPNQQNKKAKSIWETLASDIKKNEGYEDDSYIDSKSMQKEIIGKDTFEDAKKKVTKKEGRIKNKQEKSFKKESFYAFDYDTKNEKRYKQQYYYKKNPLQNAIVWSEILAKPKALRDDF